MRFTRRMGVSPIIATLLLIAIAVAAAIIVYVFVNSISGNLTAQGGAQVSDQMSMDAYSFSTLNGPSFVLRDVGSSSLTITSLYYDGNLCQASGNVCTGVTYTVGSSPECQTGPACTAGEYVPTTLALSANAVTGTSNLIRVVTSDGGTFTFSIIAGRSG